MGTLPLLSEIPVQVIKEQIEELESLDRRNTSYDDLKQKVHQLFRGHSCLTRRITSELAWRARKNICSDLFRNIKDLWYPPASCLRGYQRLNRPGRPLLYVSGSHTTATLEIQPQIGDWITILEMRLRDNTVFPRVMELGIAEMASLYRFPTNVRLLEQTSIGLSYLKGNENKNLIIRSFLARELTRVVTTGEEHHFKVTAAIAEILMSSDRIDGVEYPSIAGFARGKSFKGGANMALKPQSADRLYVPAACWVVKVLEKVTQPQEGYLVEVVEVARQITDDGVIVW